MSVNYDARGLLSGSESMLEDVEFHRLLVVYLGPARQERIVVAKISAGRSPDLINVDSSREGD